MFGNFGAVLNGLSSLYQSNQYQSTYADAVAAQQAHMNMKMQTLHMQQQLSNHFKPAKVSIKCNGCGSMEFRTHRGVQVCSYCRVSQS